MYELFKRQPNKKAVMENLSGLAIGVAALVITLVVVFLLMAELRANAKVTADANATAAVTTAQQDLDDIPGWVGIVIVAVVGVILLGLIAMFRGKRR